MARPKQQTPNQTSTECSRWIDEAISLRDDARSSHATMPIENRASLVDAFLSPLISTIPFLDRCIVHGDAVNRMTWRSIRTHL